MSTDRSHSCRSRSHGECEDCGCWCHLDAGGIYVPEHIPVDLTIMRQRFRTWVERHPCDDKTLWHVSNCVGDLIKWQENPFLWLDSKEADRNY